MLSIQDNQKGYGRRTFLKIGSLTLGGLSLSNLIQTEAIASTKKTLTSGKSVIFLFMHGGPSQIETFDPKMTAPAGIRSATGEHFTTIPGVTFGGTFPKLSQVANNFSFVRSFQTGDGNHDIKPVVSRDTLNANLGSIFSRVAGTNHPVTGIPMNTALYPQAVDPSTRPTTMQFGKFESTGPLGSAYAPFAPGSGSTAQEDMRLTLPLKRLDDRRHLLSHLDRLKKEIDSTGILEGTNRFREQAFSTILGSVAESFDLSKEDPRTISKYDTSRMMRPENISKKWNNYNNYVDNAKSLGKLLLLARRLCEAGCGFVTITTNFVWDMHSDVNNAGVEEGMQYMGRPFDHAVSAFLEDVESRGLSDKILLVACGEMGRTPKINKRGGRDHWGKLAPLLLAGGGLKGGQVIGQSTRDAGEPLSSPIRINNLVSTIMHTLLNIDELRIAREIPGNVISTITAADPIRELL